MNNRFHKVIFSQSQQQFVVVSELAKSSGKSSALPKAKVDDVFSLLFDNIFSNSELHLQSQTWQNNQLQAGKIVTNSANGKLLLDATTVKANRWEGEVQDFEAKSRQDVTKYSSEQVQAGGSVSVTYGSGGGATFNAAYNSAKLNTAQVENQTAIDIGKGGMDVKVKKNAHFDGAVMTSQAEKENNRFQAGTLTTSDIENHSELKTQSAAISGGTSGVNPMSALSLLGNKNKSERSTTKAAIGENINIVLTNDENAEQTLNKLNRDTQNANQKVTKHDISEVKETQELVKGIGEIAEKAYQIYTHSEREKVTEAKLALGKAQAQKASKEEIGKLEANLDRLQKEFDKNYGTGSKTKRAVDAVTAALQGLAAKDVGQAAVGLASPYLNEQIKKYTEGDTQANLIAHALLGAVEAAATGNNVLAGAAAGAGSEAAADFIVKTLYKGKSTQDLTEAEKQNVTLLSQLASGLASGLIGDSTQSAAVGADIGKRAVENNYLTKQEAERKRALDEKAKAGTITTEEELERNAIAKKDIETDLSLISVCEENRLSTQCQTERQKLEQAKFSYSGAEYTPTGYNYPTYTRYSDLYSKDYEKVATFSERYDVLKNAKMVANQDFSRYSGLSENIVNKISLWGDFLSNGISLYSGSRFGKYDQYVPMNEQIKFHLSNEHGFDRKGIKGGHNLDKFISSLYSNEINGKIRDIIPTPYKGIYDVYYQIPAFDGKGNNIGFKNIKEPKTVYDGSIYNDNSMYNLAKDAVATSYRDHIDRQGFKNYSVTYDGIRFRVYIDPNTGEVRNVHPSSK